MNKKIDKEVNLIVSESFQQDVGYGRARIDHQSRMDLDLSIGDSVEIIGKKTTPAIVWRGHPTDEGKKIIRIDNLTRKNLDVEIGAKVTIRKINPKDAEKVTLSPIIAKDQQIEFGWGIEKLIQKSLRNRSLSKDDTLIAPGVSIYGRSLLFKVMDIVPDDIVCIQKETKIEISSEVIYEEPETELSETNVSKSIKKEEEKEPYTLFNISKKDAKETERKLEHILIDSIYAKDDYLGFCKKAFPKVSEEEIYKIIYFTYYC